MKKILKELPILVDAGVITEKTALDIKAYYSEIKPAQGKLTILFAILGALLIGLGIILILAHNWDNLDKSIKTALVFLPLILGQSILGFVLFNKSKSTAWREGAATFLFCAVGASIALVSQVYNISGSLGEFLLTWMLLVIALVYIANSSIVSLLYIVGVTYYACETGYWTYPASEALWYWLLLILVVPHYYQLWRKSTTQNFLQFHHWLFAISTTIVLGTLSNHNGELMLVAYISLFGLFYAVSDKLQTSQRSIFKDGYGTLSVLGSVGLLLFLSFHWYWEELTAGGLQPSFYGSREFMVAILISGLALLLFLKRPKQTFGRTNPLAYTFLIFIPVFVIGLYNPLIATIAINLLVLWIGLYHVIVGIGQHNLVGMNFGILVTAALVACRFFDLNLSFVTKGLLFMVVGVGFFLANYILIKRNRNTHPHK